MKIMRTHNEPDFLPKKGSNRDICMHYGPLTRRFQTANSMVVEIGSKYMLIWFTYSSNPCVSLYKPLFFGVESVGYNKEYWENTEKLHKSLSMINDISIYRKAMDETVKSQMQINEIMNEIRNKMKSNGRLESSYISQIYEKIRIIDNKHLETLSALL